MTRSPLLIAFAVIALAATGCLGNFEAGDLSQQQDRSGAGDQPPQSDAPPAGDPGDSKPPSESPPEVNPPKEEPPKQEPPKQEPPKEEPPKQEPPPPTPPPPSTGVLGPQKITGSGTDGDLYVSPSGSDSNSGTMSKPLKTITRAGKLAKPGDLIYIRGGSYGRVKIENLKGTSSAPITFRAFPGEKPIIDGNIKDSAAGANNGLVLHMHGDNRHLIFDGLTVTDNSDFLKQARKLDLSRSADVEKFIADIYPKLESDLLRGIRINADANITTAGHLTFKNMTVHNIGDMAFSINNHISPVRIENSLIYDIGYPKSGYGVYYHGHNFVFRNNIVYNAVYGLHVYNRGNDIQNVLVENNYFYNVGLKHYFHLSRHRANLDKGLKRGDPGYLNPVKTGGDAILLDDPGSGGKVLNNIVRNSEACIHVALPNTVVAHNLVYGCKTGIRVARSNAQLYNNVVHSNEKDFAFDTSPSTERGTVRSTSVVLVDSSKPERGLSGSAAVKDKGVYFQGVTKDILGKSRDNVPDPGPFEI